MESDVMSDIPEKIDKMFEKYNRKAEMLLRKYERDFSEIEEELRLSSKLRLIRKQKEKLRENTNERKENTIPSIPDKNEIFHTDFSSESDEIERKDDYSEKKLKEDDAMKDQQKELQKKLDMCIQLAAKYKEQAIYLDTRLHEVARSEHELRSFLQTAAHQEVEAKKKLEEFISEILDRAEKAEEKVKAYKSRLNLLARSREANENRSLPPFLSPTIIRNDQNARPLYQRNYTSSSAPATPRQPQRKLKHQRKTISSEVNDDYVAQFLEAPSSQELPRRWNKMRDRSADQLPGIDLSNIIDSAVVWPFAETHFHQGSSSGRYTRYGHSPRSIPQSIDSDVTIRRRIVLFCVFAYLDTETLLRCALVCREWRGVSKHPKLWTRVTLDSKQISSQFLATLSTWCKETCYIRLADIKGRTRQLGETSKEYNSNAVGSLEDGVECLLQACGKNLTVLDIIKCDPYITRRVIWMASCYNREVRSITYRSRDPLNQEIIWSLGAGCRNLLSLDVAPLKSW